MANLEVIALNPATPQLRAPGAGDGYLFPRPMTLTIGAITTDVKVLDSTVEWNNAGITFNALKLNVTDTASAGVSKLIDLQVGGVSKFNVNKAGGAAFSETITLSTGDVSAVNGVGFFSIISLGGASNQIGFTSTGISESSSTSLRVDTGFSSTTRDLQVRRLRTEATTVGSLGSAATAGAGARSLVTNATLALAAGIGTVVAAGGANIVPVFSDGTNWIIG